MLRLCFQCFDALLVPSDDGTMITVSGFGVPTQALRARELLPALYACGVRYIELLERLEGRGRPSYDLRQLHDAPRRRAR